MRQGVGWTGGYMGPSCAGSPSFPGGVQCAPLQCPPLRAAATGRRAAQGGGPYTRWCNPVGRGLAPAARFSGLASHISPAAKYNPQSPPSAATAPFQRSLFRLRAGRGSGAPRPIPPVRGKWPKAKRGRDRRALRPRLERGGIPEDDPARGPGPTGPTVRRCPLFLRAHNVRPYNARLSGLRQRDGGPPRGAAPTHSGSTPVGAAAFGRPPAQRAKPYKTSRPTHRSCPSQKQSEALRQKFFRFLSFKKGTKPP